MKDSNASQLSLCNQLSHEVVPLPSPGREPTFKSANKRPSIAESNIEIKKKKKQKRRKKKKKSSSMVDDDVDQLHASIDALEANLRTDPEVQKAAQASQQRTCDAIDRLARMYTRHDCSMDYAFDSP